MELRSSWLLSESTGQWLQDNFGVSKYTYISFFTHLVSNVHRQVVPAIKRVYQLNYSLIYYYYFLRVCMNVKT